MIISRGRKYIFVHIPKTGGTSLALALEDRAKADDILIGDTPKAIKRRKRLKGIKTSGRLWKHSRLCDIQGLVRSEEIMEMFTFTLVRNPWDRVVSYYHWLQTQSFSHPAVDLAKTLSFEDFVAAPHTAQSLSSASVASYLTVPGYGEKCNAYIRLEFLKDDLAPVEAHLGFSLSDIAHVNKSHRKTDYTDYFTNESRDLVARYCSEDILKFGYRFGKDPDF